MAEIPTTFQLPFVLSSRKRVLHWRGRSTSCIAFSASTNTGKVSQDSTLAAGQGFMIMHSLLPVRNVGLRKRRAQQQGWGFVIMCRWEVFSICQKNTFHIRSITIGLY